MSRKSLCVWHSCLRHGWILHPLQPLRLIASFCTSSNTKTMPLKVQLMGGCAIPHVWPVAWELEKRSQQSKALSLCHSSLLSIKFSGQRPFHHCQQKIGGQCPGGQKVTRLLKVGRGGWSGWWGVLPLLRDRVQYEEGEAILQKSPFVVALCLVGIRQKCAQPAWFVSLQLVEVY